MWLLFHDMPAHDYDSMAFRGMTRGRDWSNDLNDLVPFRTLKDAEKELKAKRKTLSFYNDVEPVTVDWAIEYLTLRAMGCI